MDELIEKSQRFHEQQQTKELFYLWDNEEIISISLQITNTYLRFDARFDRGLFLFYRNFYVLQF